MKRELLKLQHYRLVSAILDKWGDVRLANDEGAERLVIHREDMDALCQWWLAGKPDAKEPVKTDAVTKVYVINGMAFRHESDAIEHAKAHVAPPLHGGARRQDHHPSAERDDSDYGGAVMRDLEADLKLCEEMDAAFWEWSDGDTWHKATQSFKAGIAALRELQAVYAVLETGNCFMVAQGLYVIRSQSQGWGVRRKMELPDSYHPTLRAALHRAWELSKESK